MKPIRADEGGISNLPTMIFGIVVFVLLLLTLGAWKIAESAADFRHQISSTFALPL